MLSRGPTLGRLPRLSIAVIVASVWMLGTRSLVNGQQDLADIIERCEKSVVRIEVDGKAGPSLGSGFVVSADGMFITNVHVLAGARSAIATFPNGQSCRITGTYSANQAKDICVAQLDANNLPVLEFAENFPRKGEKVTALGSPQGLSFSATTGIVSAVRSAKEMATDVGDKSIQGTWVQVDTPLSPGNSGGPLINTVGEVVAMSTLASRGSAQNLNFGISADDIRGAVAAANGKELIAFADDVGKIDMGDTHPESAELIDRNDIPAAALADYVALGRRTYADLEKKLRKESYEAEKTLSEMKRGTAGGGIPRGQFGVRDTGRGMKYYYGDAETKDHVIGQQQDLVDDLKKAKEGLTSTITDDALFQILWHYGPRLDPRNENSIGFMSKAEVIHPYNKHDVAIVYDDAPFLLWVKSTAGLAGGQSVTSGPVYVAGTETIQIPSRGSMAVTVLHAVTESELRSAIFGEAGDAGTEQYRTWTDTTGKFKVEASIVQVDGQNVVLKKRDGETVTVPLLKLSAEDLKFLKK